MTRLHTEEVIMRATDCTTKNQLPKAFSAILQDHRLMILKRRWRTSKWERVEVRTRQYSLSSTTLL